MTEAAFPTGSPSIPPPSPPSHASGRIECSDVYLLTTSESGDVALPDLGIVMDETGVAVLKPDGVVAALLPWDKVLGVTPRTHTATPDGSGATALVLELQTAARVHRFVIPSDDPGALETAIVEFAGAHSQSRGAKRLPSIVVAAALAGIAILVVVLILVGTHVI